MTGSITAGKGPRDFGLAAGGGTLLVTNLGAGLLEAVRLDGIPPGQQGLVLQLEAGHGRRLRPAAARKAHGPRLTGTWPAAARWHAAGIREPRTPP